MIKQESFKNGQKTLYIVATPIGNLDEMTPRAIEILKEVDLIAAEDTRHAGKLLHHFGIKTHTIAHHAYNENEGAQHIVNLFDTHESIALISDAGYPLISDPGQPLVQAVIAQGYNVVPISGSSAFLNALVVSGLVAQPFAFMGFMEAKESALIKQLENYKDLPMTTIYYLSVHKLQKTLDIIYNVLGNREISLSRELTKRHEEIIRGSVKEVIENIDTIKGEFVICIDRDRTEKTINYDALNQQINKRIESGDSPSRAISQVAKEAGVSKNSVYDYYHDN